MLTGYTIEKKADEITCNGARAEYLATTVVLTNNKGKQLIAIEDFVSKTKTGAVLNLSLTKVCCYEKYFMLVKETVKTNKYYRTSYHTYSAYGYDGKFLGDSVCKFKREKLEGVVQDEECAQAK